MSLPPGIPLLVVDGIWRDAANQDDRADKDYVHAAIRLAGHPLQVTIDLASRYLGLAAHVEMPWLLGSDVPSMHAVIGLMRRFHTGGHVEFPVDLSEEVARSGVVSRFLHNPMDDVRVKQEAEGVNVDVMEIQITGTYPAAIRAVLRLDGNPVDLEIKLHAGPGCVPVTRVLQTSRQLTLPEFVAVQRRLAQELNARAP